MELKNKLYLIIDEKNEVIVNSTISLSNDLAKNQIINSLKQSIYIFKNSLNLAEKSKILSYLTNAQDFALYSVNLSEIKMNRILDYSAVLKPYENLLKLTKEDVVNEVKKN